MYVDEGKTSFVLLLEEHKGCTVFLRLMLHDVFLVICAGYRSSVKDYRQPECFFCVQHLNHENKALFYLYLVCQFLLEAGWCTKVGFCQNSWHCSNFLLSGAVDPKQNGVRFSSRCKSRDTCIFFLSGRYIAICWPFHRRRICTRSFSYRLIGCVSLVASLFSVFKPITSRVSESGANRRVCARNPDELELSFLLDSVYGVLITALPFLIITLLNLLILKKLLCHQREQKDLRAVSTKESRMRVEFTLILLSISSFFVLLNFPYFIVWCQRFTSHNEATSGLGNQNGGNSSVQQMAEKAHHRPPRNALYFTQTIFYLNYAINFFLYCLTGKQYRKYMRKLLCCEGDNSMDRQSSTSCRSGFTSQSFVFNQSIAKRSPVSVRVNGTSGRDVTAQERPGSRRLVLTPKSSMAMADVMF